jgi:uncharacterized protein
MAKKELPILANGATVKPKRLKYDCSKCPGYCCTYDWIKVTKTDIKRLAKHHGLTYEEAEAKFTRYEPDYKHFILRHKKDRIFKSSCQFLDSKLRRCTIYEARPALCRMHPEENRCGYYDFLMWERKHQSDDEFIPMARG